MSSPTHLQEDASPVGAGDLEQCARGITGVVKYSSGGSERKRKGGRRWGGRSDGGGTMEGGRREGGEKEEERGGEAGGRAKGGWTEMAHDHPHGSACTAMMEDYEERRNGQQKPVEAS